MVMDKLSLEEFARAREILDRADVPDAVMPYVVTGREARRIGMPDRLINRARMAPVEWQGILVKVVGL